MKHTVTLLSLFLVTCFLHAAKPFEGSYEVTVESSGRTMVSTVFIKGADMRFEMDMGGMQNVMLMQDGMSTMTVLMPAQRMYMQMPIPGDVTADVEKEAKEDIPFEKTGKAKTIEGFKAHEYLIKQGKETMTVWATDALGSLAAMNTPMMQGVATYLKEVTGLKAFFPLEMSTSKSGKGSFSMKIRNIKQGPLDAALFAPPANYKQMNLPAGMGGLMGR